MNKSLRILVAQINQTVGAIFENTQKIKEIIERHQHSHDVILFPELAITGYPPEDLLFRETFSSRVNQALEEIQKTVTTTCQVIVGHPSFENGKHYNSASIFSHHQRLAIYHKQCLPNYGVFDEMRYFSRGHEPCLITIGNYRCGICICEDLWHEGPVETLVENGATLLFCLNASPFEIEKPNFRETLLKRKASLGISIVYANLTGGQDELLFDGQSMAVDKKGELKMRAPLFEESFETVLFDGETVQGTITPLPDRLPLLYQALTTGIKDYVQKNRFKGVLIGLSGGIDSALTLALAVDALGASLVRAVMMPSPYTASMSIEDAKKEAQLLGVQYDEIPIDTAMTVIETSLRDIFRNAPKDVTEENIQARLRGLFLMALSNKTGYMVLATGNKSEMATGYATLYGDMAGGFAPLKDVLKGDVYALSRFKNETSPVIPERVLTRAPSAELRENQCDQDSLPDYEILDQIISLYMEKNLDSQAIIELGFLKEDVTKVISLILKNEYKRRQSAPGIKLGTRAFGRDWRFPITSRYEDPCKK